MSGAAILAEVAAALREAGRDTGNGALTATITPVALAGNPWDVPGTPAAPVAVVVILDEFKRTEIDGARILSGDKKVLCEAGVIVPKVGDGITISGHAHRIEQVWPLAPAGVAVMYTLQAREV
jgi:hypothetical protein